MVYEHKVIRLILENDGSDSIELWAKLGDEEKEDMETLEGCKNLIKRVLAEHTDAKVLKDCNIPQEDVEIIRQAEGTIGQRTGACKIFFSIDKVGVQSQYETAEETIAEFNKTVRMSNSELMVIVDDVPTICFFERSSGYELIWVLDKHISEIKIT